MEAARPAGAPCTETPETMGASLEWGHSSRVTLAVGDGGRERAVLRSRGAPLWPHIPSLSQCERMSLAAAIYRLLHMPDIENM